MKLLNFLTLKFSTWYDWLLGPLPIDFPHHRTLRHGRKVGKSKTALPNNHHNNTRKYQPLSILYILLRTGLNPYTVPLMTFMQFQFSNLRT